MTVIRGFLNWSLVRLPVTSAVLAILSGTGCTVHHPGTSDTGFLISSQPQGATVTVMGQALGLTPLRVDRRQVFPTSYPEDLHLEYGKVTLSYANCTSYTTPINNTILKEGLNVRLTCPSAQRTGPLIHPKATTGKTRQRLIELRALYEEGLVTEQEYQNKRRAILDEL